MKIYNAYMLIQDWIKEGNTVVMNLSTDGAVVCKIIDTVAADMGDDVCVLGFGKAQTLGEAIVCAHKVMQTGDARNAFGKGIQPVIIPEPVFADKPTEH